MNSEIVLRACVCRLSVVPKCVSHTSLSYLTTLSRYCCFVIDDINMTFRSFFTFSLPMSFLLSERERDGAVHIRHYAQTNARKIFTLFFLEWVKYFCAAGSLKNVFLCVEILHWCQQPDDVKFIFLCAASFKLCGANFTYFDVWQTKSSARSSFNAIGLHPVSVSSSSSSIFSSLSS